MSLSRGKKLTLLVIALLTLDQVVKILVKVNMHIGDSIPVLGERIQIYFIENEGMAFGMAFGGVFGKYVLTIFRIVLIVLLTWYIRSILRREETPFGVLVGLALILVGAAGNVFDCLLYGQIFSESTYQTVATLFPAGGGYAPIGQGKVVDMIYCPVIDTVLPEGFPIWGGEQFIFFRPIFNVADSCITIGAFYLILFQWKFFSKKEEEQHAA